MRSTLRIWEIICVNLVVKVAFWKLVLQNSCLERILLLICMFLQFMWRKELLLQGTCLWKTLQILTVFDWLCCTQCLTSFFFYRSPSSSCTVSDAISCNINEVLSINQSSNVSVFGYFNVHHNDWLTYSGGTDSPDELCYNFSV